MADASLAAYALLGGPLGMAYYGSQQQGQAAQSMSEQQLAAQQAQQQQALGYAGQAQGASAPTAQELANLDQNLQQMQRTYMLQNAALQRDTQLLSSVDPALISAGQNAYKMLNGQSAPTLAPIQQQRAQQRQQLQQSLQQQFGSGYAQSSAGTEALNRFDQETSQIMAQAQQSYTGMLLGTAAGARPNMPGEVNQAGMTLGQLSGEQAGMYGALQGRQMQGYGGQANALTGNSVVPLTGANQVASLQQGQFLGNLGSQFTGGMANAAGTSAGRSMYGSAGGGMPYQGGAGSGGFNMGGSNLGAFNGSYNTLGQFGGAGAGGMAIAP